MSETCGGWRIVCPDGRVRHYPYHNEGDAKCDARVYGRPTRPRIALTEEGPPEFAALPDPPPRMETVAGCTPYPDDPAEWSNPPCPQGEHRVEMIAFEHPSEVAP